MIDLDPLSFAYSWQSYSGNPALSPGTAVTCGNSNADGTAVALGSALTHELMELEVKITCATATIQTGVDTSAILEIGIDPAGGTSFDWTNPLIEGLFCGGMSANTADGKRASRIWTFPLYIPSGAALGVRGRSVVGSGNTTVEVALTGRGGPSGPLWYGHKVDAIGLNKAASGGTSITPDATSNQAWASVSWNNFGSATGRRYGLLIPSVATIGATVASAQQQFQVGISSVQIGPTFDFGTISTEGSADMDQIKRIMRDIAEGAQLQIRSRAGAAAQAASQYIIHGVAA